VAWVTLVLKTSTVSDAKLQLLVIGFLFDRPKLTALTDNLMAA